ncbi:MAG: DUF1573 domain-containing protein [Bacteroidales bacterium]|jgi:hypothetical protein|nr:DUF1573 domain-containing protein [Bacteroidales bacterium]
MKLLLLLLTVLIGGRAQFDRTVHDFGTISQADGPQTCVFTVTNTGDEPLTILSAISSCGCTNVRWTRTSLAKGEKGTIEATYTNEDGPYPFDKTITVYLSDIRKPVVLHLRGVVK